MSPDLGRFPRKHALVHRSIGKIQLVVSRLFTTGYHQTKKSSDNRLSADTSKKKLAIHLQYNHPGPYDAFSLI